MTLVQLFTAIANAIRNKMGTQALIAAEDFPDEIASIETGKLTNEEYQEANDDLDDILEDTTEWHIDNAYGLFDSNRRLNVMDGLISTFKDVTDTSYMFNACGNITTAPMFDMSKVTAATYMFYACYNLRSVPAYDISSVTNTTRMFFNCFALPSVPSLDTSNVTNMGAMFSGCNALTTVPQLNMSKATNLNTVFSNCYNLSNESLNNILASLLTATSYAGTKTLATIGLSLTQATTCQGLSNWVAVSAAGWTTGY